MITNEILIVSVITIIGSLVGFYWKLKKQILDEESSKNKPLLELNKNIIELNATIKHLIDDISNLKDRVTGHGKDIDKLKLDVEELKTKVHLYHEAK